jgi:hypothetical protein
MGEDRLPLFDFGQILCGQILCRLASCARMRSRMRMRVLYIIIIYIQSNTILSIYIYIYNTLQRGIDSVCVGYIIITVNYYGYWVWVNNMGIL